MGIGPRAQFTGKRRRNVEKRLEDGYAVEDLFAAVDGCSVTPHNMGENDRGEAFNDLELICRDAAHVDRFIRNAASPPRAPTKAIGGRTAPTARDLNGMHSNEGPLRAVDIEL